MISCVVSVTYSDGEMSFRLYPVHGAAPVVLCWLSVNEDLMEELVARLDSCLVRKLIYIYIVYIYNIYMCVYDT